MSSQEVQAYFMISDHKGSILNRHGEVPCVSYLSLEMNKFIAKVYYSWF